jgi:predicted MPP superfamily phosphohydrolase
VQTPFFIFVSFIQLILLSAHWILYQTLIGFQVIQEPSSILALRVFLTLLSVSFIPATVLSHRYSNFLVRGFYKISATWLGFLHFGFMAAAMIWISYGMAALSRIPLNPRSLAIVLFGIAPFAGVYSMINAASIRVNEITVTLPNLPESWQGRVAAFVSDIHLGHIRGVGFIRRIVTILNRIRPDVVFIAGDMFDGSAVDLSQLVHPWTEFSALYGTYFIAGNHEEFSGDTRYLDALKRSGLCILNNEKVTVDGLQIVGVHYRDSTDPQRFHSILEKARLDKGGASILLAHSPVLLEVAEKAGISLQLSGHTHAGQLFPFTWIVSRIYGPFGYGLNRLGNLMIYTSCGAGTWGAPMRMGTKPEIVLIRFEGSP